MDKKLLGLIGEVDEKELMELSGATEVEQRTTWPCATYTSTVAITIYTIDRSSSTCPTSACSSKC
ncbi:class II lanthipeptide, LchA2/BrtA2 family (plasmid) [Priestia megaterium]|uniref:class II lanthipeptide, LchA2/BrtA2 family n=1 Tax=Priestia megaterium TaxID=1404 RepID=UPI00351DD1C9